MTIRFQFTPLREGRHCQNRRLRLAAKFQFTPLREGRHAGRIHPRQTVHISIHAPPRGATAKNEVLATGKIFQFTPLREGRQYRGLTERCTRRFQFTPLREGRQAWTPTACMGISYFNSRPSARGDEHPRGVYVLGIGISIHAPPRGATDAAGMPSMRTFISIHAPPRGATA